MEFHKHAPQNFTGEDAEKLDKLFRFEDTPEQKQEALDQLKLWREEKTAQDVVAEMAGVPVEDLDQYGGWPQQQ